MDVAMIHRFLSEETYWAKGIPYAMVNSSLSNSFCMGAFLDERQIGFGRVITDYATFGWLADFFVLPEYQGQGVAKQLLAHLFEQPWATLIRRFMLNTGDAHGLYRQFGFKDLNNPPFLQEIYRPDVHLLFAQDDLAAQQSTPNLPKTH